MSPDRFESLTHAFGGDVERWPEAERDAARQLAAAQPSLTDRVIGQARRLDEVLLSAPAARPSPALRDRIILAAPSARTRASAWRWLTGAGLGAGLAAACAAGVAAGLVVAPAMTAPARPAADADPTEEAIALLRETPDLAELS